MKTLFRWLLGLAVVLAGVMYFQFGTLSPCGALKHEILAKMMKETEEGSDGRQTKNQLALEGFLSSHIRDALSGQTPAWCSRAVVGFWTDDQQVIASTMLLVSSSIKLPLY